MIRALWTKLEEIEQTFDQLRKLAGMTVGPSRLPGLEEEGIMAINAGSGEIALHGQQLAREAFDLLSEECRPGERATAPKRMTANRTARRKAVR